MEKVDGQEALFHSAAITLGASLPKLATGMLSCPVIHTCLWVLPSEPRPTGHAPSQRLDWLCVDHVLCAFLRRTGSVISSTPAVNVCCCCPSCVTEGQLEAPAAPGLRWGQCSAGQLEMFAPLLTARAAALTGMCWSGPRCGDRERPGVSFELSRELFWKIRAIFNCPPDGMCVGACKYFTHCTNAFWELPLATWTLRKHRTGLTNQSSVCVRPRNKWSLQECDYTWMFEYLYLYMVIFLHFSVQFTSTEPVARHSE